MNKIKTKAKAFGTFNSPEDSTILYVDPNHDDKRYNSPELTAAEARLAFQMGLIEDPDGAKAVTADNTNQTDANDDPNLIGNVAAARTEDTAKIDHEVDPKPSTLDSRQSTAWSNPDKVLGGADGVQEEADTPPAPKGRKGAIASV